MFTYKWRKNRIRLDSSHSLKAWLTFQLLCLPAFKWNNIFTERSVSLQSLKCIVWLRCTCKLYCKAKSSSLGLPPFFPTVLLQLEQKQLYFEHLIWWNLLWHQHQIMQAMDHSNPRHLANQPGQIKFLFYFYEKRNLVLTFIKFLKDLSSKIEGYRFFMNSNLWPCYHLQCLFHSSISS